MKLRKHQQRKNFLRDFCTKIQRYDFAVLGPVVTFHRFDFSIPKTKSEKFETAHEKRLSQNPSHGSNPYATRLLGVFCHKPCAKAYSGKSLVLQGFPRFRGRFVGRCTKTEGATCAYLLFVKTQPPTSTTPPETPSAFLAFGFSTNHPRAVAFGLWSLLLYRAFSNLLLSAVALSAFFACLLCCSARSFSASMLHGAIFLLGFWLLNLSAFHTPKSRFGLCLEHPETQRLFSSGVWFQGFKRV